MIVRRSGTHGWHEVVLLGLLIAVLLVAGYLLPGFLTIRSQLFLSRHLWEIAILATAMTLVILSGGIDLSVGSAMGLCAVAFGICFQSTGNLSLSVAVCLFTGFLGGLFNGFLISRFRLHPLIVTLATFAAFRGIAEGVSQGASYSRFGDSFSQLARADWLGFPIPGVVFVLLAACTAVFLSQTPGGRYVYSIGHNPRASRFSGVPVDRMRMALYAWSGLMAGLATVVYISRFDTAKADAGKGFELDVITAVVVGGTSIFGGRGTILGTTLGLLLIHETRLFVSRYWRTEELKSIVVGLMLITSVLIYRAVTQGKTNER